MTTRSIRQTVRLALFWVWLDLVRGFMRRRPATLGHSLAFVLFVALLATFFGTVFKRDLPGYYVYTCHLAASLAAWLFFSGCINQACSIFGEQVQVLRHVPLPFAVLPLRVTTRHTVILLQNLALTVALVLTVGEKPPLFGWLALGTALLVANMIWLTQALALACVRFRDVPQLLSGLLHLVFLLTPILWMDHFMGRYQYLLNAHPFYQLIAVVRDPLRGSVPSTASLAVSAGLLAAGGVATLLAWRRFARCVPYWI